MNACVWVVVLIILDPMVYAHQDVLTMPMVVDASYIVIRCHWMILVGVDYLCATYRYLFDSSRVVYNIYNYS